jgi:hypothetical protein
MLIMMNSKILAEEDVVTESTALLSVSAVTISSPAAYNNYTLLTLRASTPSQILPFFPSNPTSTKTTFSVYPFIISDLSSMVADENNMDIMIATVDGIDGPKNKLRFVSFFMVNAYTLMRTPLSSLNMGFVAYSGSQQMDGSKVPTLLRVRNTDNASGFNMTKVVVFFDEL